jgi:hypothetical protein
MSVGGGEGCRCDPHASETPKLEFPHTQNSSFPTPKTRVSPTQNSSLGGAETEFSVEFFSSFGASTWEFSAAAPGVVSDAAPYAVARCLRPSIRAARVQGRGVWRDESGWHHHRRWSAIVAVGLLAGWRGGWPEYPDRVCDVETYMIRGVQVDSALTTP